MNTTPKWLRIAKKLLVQSWVPALIALAYALWDYLTMPTGQRTPAALVHSWGVTFFLVMWFAGQWFRASKQVTDADELTSIREKMDKSLVLLENLADKAASETPTIASPAGSTGPAGLDREEQPVGRVLEELARSPKAALLILGTEIERELRQLLWSSGWIQGVGKATITRSVGHLVNLGVVPANLGSSVSVFLDIRNKLLHGYGVTDDEVLRAIDTGITILRAVLAIPLEVHRVYHPGVDVFEDEQGTRLRTAVKGVVLESTTPGGSEKVLRVYPTTKTWYKVGQKVSWEWNLGLDIDQSWFKHPDTSKIEPAWLQSAEFIGRDLDGL